MLGGPKGHQTPSAGPRALITFKLSINENTHGNIFSHPFVEIQVLILKSNKKLIFLPDSITTSIICHSKKLKWTMFEFCHLGSISFRAKLAEIIYVTKFTLNIFFYILYCFYFYPIYSYINLGKNSNKIFYIFMSD